MKEITNLIDTQNYYYDLLRDNQAKVLQKLEEALPYYRFSFNRKSKTQEIIYDTANNLLASAGFVLSKVCDNGKYFFIIKKVSYLPKKFKKPSVMLFKAECSNQDMPSMFPVKLAGVISDSAPGIFTVDLVEIINLVVPRIEIVAKGDKFNIASGNGYKAEMNIESVQYKDLTTKKKFKNKNVVFLLSGDKNNEKDNHEILSAVLKKCKELFPYDETRFEIARRVLTARSGEKKKFSKKEYLKEQKEAEEKKKENEG